MKNLNAKWQKLIIWLTGYSNLIAFMLAGGYVYLKTDDEDVKISAKYALILVAVFTGVSILYSIIYNVLSGFNVDYTVLNVISDVNSIISAIKCIVFVTAFVLDLCGIKFLPISNKADKTID